MADELAKALAELRALLEAQAAAATEAERAAASAALERAKAASDKAATAALAALRKQLEAELAAARKQAETDIAAARRAADVELATARADAAAALAEREATLALLAEASADAADVQGRYDLVRRQLQEALEGPAGRVVGALMDIQAELVSFQAEADNRKNIKKSASGAGGGEATPPQEPAAKAKRGSKA
jgi:hypothetical protein